MKTEPTTLKWRCHIPKLFEEVLTNEGAAALRIPLRITLNILGEVAERAIELNDDKLNELMMRLTLYSCADPTSEDYNPELMSQFKEPT